MIIVRWNDDTDTRECICVDIYSAWSIYWCVKKYIDSTDPSVDCRMLITTITGVILDPEMGQHLPTKSEQCPTMLKKARG